MSFLDTLKQITRSVAPTIATALGGPLAGSAVKFLGNALLGDEDASEEAVTIAMQNASPEQLLKLKELDYKYKSDMAKAGIDLAKLEAEDKQSARAREISLSKIGKKNIVLNSIAILMVVGYFALLFIIFFHKIDPSMKDTFRDTHRVNDDAIWYSSSLLFWKFFR